MKSFVKAIICGFVFSVLFSFTNFSAKCDSISGKIFRLHILANSDSEEDQTLKLKVRDRILKDFGNELALAEDIIDAENITRAKLDEIVAAAKDEIAKNGKNYSVKAEITNMYFNNRIYGDFTAPAGFYKALRITIGEAKGKNWWCVMFPPLCLPAAQADNDLCDVLQPGEVELMLGGAEHKFAFKSVEWVIKSKELFEDNVLSPATKVLNKLDLNYEVDFKLAHVLGD